MKNYWANAPVDEIATNIDQKCEDYLHYLERTGIRDELQKSYNLFYGNSAIIEHEDAQVTMQVNHYASLIRSIHTMVTQNRPAFEARAINSDYESQAITLLANGLLDYYLRDKKLEEHLKKAAELALFLREGWIVANWNTEFGEPYAVNPDSGEAINSGDVEYKTMGLLEVIRDANNKYSENTWFITRTKENKWDLAAAHPELESEIVGFDDPNRIRWELSYTNNLNQETDFIEVRTLYHAKTKAMPNGRLVRKVGNKVIFDGPLPYKKPYLFCIKANDAYQSAFGHSPAMDLIPLQDALDSCFSVALSNINSFGLGNLISEKGSIQVNEIRKGLLHIEHNKGSEKPSMLNMLQIPPQLLEFANIMTHAQETISGVNSVARGNVERAMSGTAMALVAQQALVFSSGVQQSYNNLLESVGNSLIELLQTFAIAPRVARIAGKSKKSYMRSFQAADLESISSVTVESKNAITNTTAGKVEVATNLLNSGLISTPEQYIQVVTTGTLEPLTEFDTAQLMLIREENEQMTDGAMVQAVMTDKHELHVREHSVILANPEVRSNPQVLQAALNHIQEHINLASTMPPVLAMMLKQQSVAPPQPGAPAAIPEQEAQNMQEADLPQPAQPPATAPQQ